MLPLESFFLSFPLAKFQLFHQNHALSYLLAKFQNFHPELFPFAKFYYSARLFSSLSLSLNTTTPPESFPRFPFREHPLLPPSATRTLCSLSHSVNSNLLYDSTVLFSSFPLPANSPLPPELSSSLLGGKYQKGIYGCVSGRSRDIDSVTGGRRVRFVLDW